MIEQGDMLTISVREPWASCILSHGKDVENRCWPCPKNIIGTTVLIHVGVNADHDGIAYLKEVGRMPAQLLPLGHIVGKVDIVGCVMRSGSKWFSGPYGFELANPVAFKKPLRYRGKLKFFVVPANIVSQLK